MQSLCLQGRPWLSLPQIEARLSRDDRRELQSLVQSDRLERQAEARVMARFNAADYLEEVNRACAERLDPQLPPDPQAGGR